MKHLIFLLLITTAVVGQNFSKILQKTNTYSGLLTAEKLAKNIEQDFTNDEDKVKAVFTWITKNIRYDLQAYYNPNRKTSYSFRYQSLEELAAKKNAMNDSIVRKTLSTRRGVCEGYARTFAKICSLLNIENEVVEGYVRSSSSEINKPRLQPNHAWNVVKINNKWIFIDATWGAGYEMNTRWIREFNPYFYDMNKKSFFKTHLPEKSIWKLQIGNMTKEDFYKQPIYSHNFLKSGINLVAPTSGILNRKNDGSIEIRLKNVVDLKQLKFGFLTSRYAQNPIIKKVKGITQLSVVPPQNSKNVFLLLNNELALEFLLE